MRKLSSSIIVLILCIITSYKILVPSGCYGLVEGLWILFFSFIILLFLAILLFVSIYKKIKFKKEINPFPLITFGICLTIIALILFLQSERFKSERVLTGIGDGQELVLRKNKQYELKRKEPEFGCVEKGTFNIDKDTLFLFEAPAITMTLYINEKFLIDTKNGIIIPVYGDSLETDIYKYLKIKN